MQVQVGFNNIGDPRDVRVLVSVLLVFLLYFIALIFARRADKRDREKVLSLVDALFQGSPKVCFHARLNLLLHQYHLLCFL